MSHVAHRKEPYKRDYILQKRPIILGSLLIVATPYLACLMSHTQEQRKRCERKAANSNPSVNKFDERYVVSINITQDMGWLRLVGSLKLQVSFAKEPYKRDDIQLST